MMKEATAISAISAAVYGNPRLMCFRGQEDEGQAHHPGQHQPAAGQDVGDLRPSSGLRSLSLALVEIVVDALGQLSGNALDLDQVRRRRLRHPARRAKSVEQGALAARADALDTRRAGSS